MCCRFLVALAVVGLAAGARERRQKSPGISAIAPADSSGVWSAASPPDFFSAKSLSFTPPGSKERTFNVVVERAASRAAPSESDQVAAMRGNDGDAEMTAILQQDGNIAGSIVDPEAGVVHQFMGQDGGELSFVSRASDKFADELDPEEDGLENATDRVAAGEGAESGSRLNVLVVWTKEAECLNARMSAGCRLSSSTKSQMRAKINLAVQETNDAYVFSRINTRITLVHAYRHPSYAEQTFSRDLSNLRGTSDGYMDDVHALRDQYKAHFVALINGDRQYCGLAYMGPRKSSMFSVTSQGCATGYYSFGHEMGHNMGCNHDRGTTGQCSSSRSNFGYRDPEGYWRDTLSYSCKTTDCLQQPVKGSCTRMKFYSNPNVRYNGKPTGWAGKADLAKQINSVTATVGSYYSR